MVKAKAKKSATSPVAKLKKPAKRVAVKAPVRKVKKTPKVLPVKARSAKVPAKVTKPVSSKKLAAKSTPVQAASKPAKVMKPVSSKKLAAKSTPVQAASKPVRGRKPKAIAEEIKPIAPKGRGKKGRGSSGNSGATAQAGNAAAAQPVVPVGLDVTEKVKELVRLAKEQGYLTYNDINDSLGDNTPTPDDLDEIYTKLHNLDVEIVDQAEVDVVKQPEPEEEEVKANVSAISEKVFLTWEKNPKAKGGKSAFIDSEVKKARDLHTLENKDKEQKSKFDRPPVAE